MNKEKLLIILIIFTIISLSIKFLLDNQTNCLAITSTGQDITSGINASDHFFGDIKNSCLKIIQNPTIQVFIYNDGIKKNLIDTSNISVVSDKIYPLTSIKYDFKFKVANQSLNYKYFYELHVK